MTPLNKPVRRLTNTTSNRGRRFVIEIRPGMTETVVIREERRRTGYQVPIETIYKLGARLYAEQTRKERKDRKRGKQ